MLSPAQRLKEKLQTDEPTVGLMATDHAWPFLVEICQKAGLDYLVIDSEHGDFSDELVSHICQIGRLTNFPVLVRTISCEPTVVRRTIDLGPSGILIPCVESTEQLDQTQQAIWMPPRGRRRPGGMGNYWMNDFQYETWKADFEDHFIVIPQIESQAGADNADALAAHPLVTALGLGPYDLSADLGCCWNPDDDAFKAALAQVKKAADAVGKKVWAGCDGPSLRAQGYSFLWIGTATLVLTNALADAVQAIKT
jgi:2-keto-3-deoxy-L-rhamnonate aldolase RhmA